MKGNREQLVITEIPFNVNRAGARRADRRLW
jgi:DNA gyrase/topoisomerase IV subunit A